MIVRCNTCGNLQERFGTGEYQEKDKTFRCKNCEKTKGEKKTNLSKRIKGIIALWLLPKIALLWNDEYIRRRNKWKNNE